MMLQLCLSSAVFAAVLSISLIEVVQADWMDTMLNEVNKERAKVDASPLCYNSKLIAAAEVHSADMAKNEFLDHTGSDDSSAGDRIDDQNYDWLGYAENIASGYKTVASVMDGWMNSQGHKENLLYTEYTQFGAAKKSNYWTQVFGKTSTEKCDSTTPATCRDLGTYNVLKTKYCSGRANGNSAKFARYWQIRDGTKANVLDTECKAKSCKKQDCCKKGVPRKCINTDDKGIKKGGFTEIMCGDNWTLKPYNQRKKAACKGKNGQCLRKNCCVRS